MWSLPQGAPLVCHRQPILASTGQRTGEEMILTEREEEVISNRRVSRHLLARLGWIRFQRYQIAREGEGGKALSLPIR
ncbi:MAG: hypothetical protein ACE5II_05555 [Anaerolineae bacterium]